MNRLVILLSLISPLACSSGGSTEDAGLTDTGNPDAGDLNPNVTGTWVGTTTYIDSLSCDSTPNHTDSLTIVLTQSGTSITGSGPNATISGTVVGNVVNLAPDINCATGQAQAAFSCTVSADGKVMTCSITGDLCESCSTEGPDDSNQPAPISNASATFTRQS